tara:strand:+ start:586 stop:846 length:261 start_codon:yes stop_codon:yes gene_type:complete
MGHGTEKGRYGSRGTIKRDKPDDTIANPNEKEQRARNQAMWGTETMLHEFWQQNVERGNKWSADVVEGLHGKRHQQPIPQHPRKGK